MGIDIIGLEALLYSQQYVLRKDSALTLGRQQIHCHSPTLNNMSKKYTLPQKYNYNDYSEPLFRDIGYSIVDSIDNSTYEGASTKRYDFIFDGGTMEHVFNTPQVLENIINSLEIGGIVCSVIPNNNMSGHGMYQVSPELFLSAYTPTYGMELLGLYIGKHNTGFESWIDVNRFNTHHRGRQCAKFNSQDEVLLISIAKKVADDRKTLLDSPPNQHSYENIDWAI